ncbi:MAG: ATP-dependent DNA helicase DinG [Rhodocyclales bacterium]|nr:ATP-dependent DNA helicase DinG [Rhodocyclales bacterium]
MVHDDEKAQIREGMDALRRGIEGFRSRRPQLEMVATVATAIGRCRNEDEAAGDGDHIAVIEAGTGTGKSFGALVPALVMARSRGRRLVVSSSTVALQHQYAEKDAPTLQRLLPTGFTFAVAKGRRRYSCTAKLLGEASDAGQHELALGDDAEEGPPETAAVRRRRTIILQLAESFESERWNGDRDELAVPVPDDIWSEITTDRQGCSGSRCSEFARCPFYAARQRVKDADLVIANHDLVLSALSVDVGGVLPPPAETVYVFDEAHSLAAKAIEHMSAKHALRGAQEWLHGATEAVRDAVLALHLDETLLRDAQLSAVSAADQLEQLRQRIHAMRAFEEKRARRFKDGKLPDWLRDGGERAREAGRGLEKTFVALREALLERAPSEGGLVTRVLAGLGFYVGKLENFLATWDLMLQQEGDGEIPVARWVELHDDGGAKDYLVCAAPISGSERLRKLLWNRASAVVLMSATLTSCGTFDLFLRQTGLTVYRGLHFLQVESPFDYRSHAKLVVPAMKCDPTDAEAHTEEVIERMPQLVHSQGTLVLFASAKQMKAVHAGLPEPLRRITLMQGSMPKMEMLARHRAAVDRGDRSVLFGLQSMAEGVDLPRAYCTHVVWSKLPFAVPDSPLEEARREWIEGQGRSYFMEVTVPETAQRFKQGLGRLIRTTEDWGVVTVLDNRLITKRWGSLLMRGIPDFERVMDARAQVQRHRQRDAAVQG